MRVKMSWILVAVLFMAALAFQPAPAQAQPPFPQGSSIVFVDFFGSLMECVDFRRCSGGVCPADAFFAGRTGECTAVDEFELGRTRTSCSWKNIDWSFFAPNTREVILDVTCSRWGSPFFFFFADPGASCGAGVTYKRILQYSVNVTFNEGYSSAAIGARRSCAAVFGAMTAEQLEDFNLRDLVNTRPWR